MPLRSLIATGTKVWLDSVEPQLIERFHAHGVTGATSNPLIIAEILQSGEFDQPIGELIGRGLDDTAIAWEMTDRLVRQAQDVFLPIWTWTRGNDGYVSFELDPLIEDPQARVPPAERIRRYVELGRRWAHGHRNRLIKVPATPAGIGALEDLAAAGVSINVTLCFTQRQYEAARDAIWRGVQRVPTRESYKSVYSIFVSRVDVYTRKHLPKLTRAAQGLVGIVNARRMWQLNQQFWTDKKMALAQEIIFASTGVKEASEPADKYVAALAGGDIQTNPPATLDAVLASAHTYTRQLDHLPPREVLDEIDREVDVNEMERVLMEEGQDKFADPMKHLIVAIGQRRHQLAGTR